MYLPNDPDPPHAIDAPHGWPSQFSRSIHKTERHMIYDWMWVNNISFGGETMNWNSRARFTYQIGNSWVLAGCWLVHPIERGAKYTRNSIAFRSERKIMAIWMHFKVAKFMLCYISNTNWIWTATRPRSSAVSIGAHIRACTSISSRWGDGGGNRLFQWWWLAKMHDEPYFMGCNAMLADFSFIPFCPAQSDEIRWPSIRVDLCDSK